MLWNTRFSKIIYRCINGKDFDCIFELGLPVETFHERIFNRALILIVTVKYLENAKCLLEGLMQ